MEKAWAIIIDDDQAACMMAIPRLFEQLPHQQYSVNLSLLFLTARFFLPVYSLYIVLLKVCHSFPCIDKIYLPLGLAQDHRRLLQKNYQQFQL
ncbi:hypothetical protein [Endozoicomonas atrinae]|uniref:hypothetical protein n=1 Tax=Endozoicomonas atrinae TaxID=1333660 RepID=UPI003B0073C4